MAIGVGVGIGLNAGGKATPLSFPVASGQTLLAREYFTSTIDSSNKGNMFTGASNGISTGQITGGMDRGCIGLIDDGESMQLTRVGGAMRRYTGSAVNRFRGYVGLTQSGSAIRNFFEAWMRFDSGTGGITTKSRLWTVGNVEFPVDDSNTGLRGLQVAVSSSGVTLMGGQAGSPADGTSSLLPLDTPIKIRFAFENVSGAWKWRGMYRLRGESSMTVFYTSNFSYAFGSTVRCYFEQLQAGAGIYSGLIAGLSRYSYTSNIDAEGTADSTDIYDFLEARKTRQIDDVLGDDNNVNGPWATPTGVQNHGFINCALVTHPTTWVDENGASANLSTTVNGTASVDDANKCAWQDEQGDGNRLPNGDTLEFVDNGNIHRFAAGMELDLTQIKGLDIDLGGGVLSGNEVMTGGSWEGWGGYNNIERYSVTGAPQAVAWPRVNGVLIPQYVVGYAGADATIVAAALLEATEQAVYSDDDGYTYAHYINHRAADADSWERWSGVTYLIKLRNGRIRNGTIECTGFEYDPDPTDATPAVPVSNFGILLSMQTDSIMVMEDISISRYGKHAAHITGDSATGIICCRRITFGGGPLEPPSYSGEDPFLGFAPYMWNAFSCQINDPGPGTAVILYDAITDVLNTCEHGSATFTTTDAYSLFSNHNTPTPNGQVRRMRVLPTCNFARGSLALGVSFGAEVQITANA